MIIAVYAPHDPRDKRMLWDYLAHVINQWQGEVVIMGDFNEVRVKSDRFGTNFNVLGANIFNSFINSTGLEEVHLGGSAFTWCHKSATKMSKLDRFFVSNNLLNIFPHISGITLDRFLSDHRPILLRESAHDYGPVPFRFFHHWIHLEGFNDFVTSTWNSAPSVDSNGMRNLAGKLKFLKAHIKIWIKDNKSETVSTIANLKKELNQLDAVIDKGTGTEVEAEKRMEVLAALRNIDHIHFMDLAQKAKIKWSIEGDENSNFFHGILNKKRNQMNIRGCVNVLDIVNECNLHLSLRKTKVRAYARLFLKEDVSIGYQKGKRKSSNFTLGVGGGGIARGRRCEGSIESREEQDCDYKGECSHFYALMIHLISSCWNLY
ncbi:RNA-directed DNA polymerase, eukaryota [Tanacetum coccineum]